jgi:hypothetical protein
MIRRAIVRADPVAASCPAVFVGVAAYNHLLDGILLPSPRNPFSCM